MLVATLPCDATASLASSSSDCVCYAGGFCQPADVLDGSPSCLMLTSGHRAPSHWCFPSLMSLKCTVAMAPRLLGTRLPTLLLLKSRVSSTSCGLHFLAWCFQERVSFYCRWPLATRFRQ